MESGGTEGGLPAAVALSPDTVTARHSCQPTCADRGLRQVYLHLIFDGRSTEPGSAPAMLKDLERQIDEIGVGRIVSGVGRGIALDRDGDYDKTRRAYDALVSGIGKPYAAH